NDDGTRTDQRGIATIIKPDGEFIIVWEDWRNDWGDIYGQRFTANGSPIGSNFKVNDDIGGTQYGASIACDSLGNFVVVWMDGRNGNWDIYGQRYNAQAVPQGNNFQVNDDPGTATQWAPSVGVAPAGNFVVAWEDERIIGNVDIYAQRYDASGTRIGSNFRINEVTTASQNSPDIVLDRSGNFVVVWTDNRDGNDDIYCRRYDASGNPLGNSFLVNDDGGDQRQYGPAIVFNQNSEFWIGWVDARNMHTDIYAQHYNSSGSPIGNNFLVNDDIASSQQRVSSIAINGSGGFVVVWEDERNGNTDIYGQRLDSNGNLIGNNLRINDDIGNASHFYSSVAADRTGGFMVAWTDGRNQSYDIYCQRFDAMGNPINFNLKVNDDLVNAHQWYPWVAMDSAGNSVIVWMDARDDNRYDIFGQRYDNAGNPVEANFKVNDDGNGYQIYASVAKSSNGAFVVTWMDERDDNFNIYAQRYDSNGIPLGSNFRVDDDMAGNYAGYPAVAIDPIGNFVIVWEDGRNGVSDIYGQLYDNQGQAVGNNFRVDDDFNQAYQYSPTAAIANDGRVIVVWSDWRFDDLDPEIFAQRFWLNGVRIGSNALINEPDTFAYEHQWTIGQSVAANSNQIGFAWTDNRRHKGFDIYGKLTDWNLIGIAEEKFAWAKNNTSFIVYPNPSDGKIIIRFELAKAMPLRICLFDACGRLIENLIELNKNRGEAHFTLPKLPRGIYFVTLETESKRISKKIILR
ncbi:MAG: T9SS type A sorting domain-containing protein, partial [candidate division WOR-3 bacterium]|nr:T9SS type A sorting domain-containing protein [candidate division WOR-3 bacterium]